MSLVSRRAARRELEAARALGVKRTTYRLKFESKADTELVKLACGVVLSIEVKSRKKLPALVTRALAQARSYEPAASPAAVLAELGGEALIVLPLRVFRVIAGIEDKVEGE